MVKRDIMVSYVLSVLALQCTDALHSEPTCNNNLDFKVGLFEPLNSLGKLHGHVNPLPHLKMHT